MSSTPRPSDSPRPETDRVDRGLAEAFGSTEPSGPPDRPTASVLRALEARTGSVLGLHITDDESDSGPVLVTDEARKLRDPSGRYHLLGEIGRGGIGVVYKGRDQDLGRDIAMKVLRDDYAERPDVLERFVEEAQIGGQLQHPGIVPVYELGLQAGERPYIAMKLVKGETLAAQLARRDDPSDDRRRLLGIFEQVCQTMAYAHARRVVHRDLKPANVMIGAFGEVQVVDWGLAKVLPKGGVADERANVERASERSVIETVRAGSGSNSVAGCMLGTPPYMPPEQAQGDVEHVDQRSDVFALGAMLCEILTGVPPYLPVGGDVVRQAATTSLEGAHDRLRKCGADAALVELSIECMSPARRARPESAAEVAGRIGAYLTSVEERAHQAELRATEARYKHRVTLVSSAAALLILVLGAGAWIMTHEAAERRRTDAAQRIAVAMSAVSGARGEAREARVDLERWTAAEASAAQLEKLLGSPDVNAKTRSEAERLVALVRDESKAAHADAQQRERDDEMLVAVRDLRIPIDHDVNADDWLQKERSRLDKAYADAFSQYLGGKSLLKQSAADAVARLRRGRLHVELAACLDHWGLIRDGLDAAADAAGTARIREVAKLLDSDNEWRAKLRELLPNAKQEGERLIELADKANFDDLSAASCRVLSQALELADEKDAELDVLRRSIDSHPRDFSLRFALGVRLERSTPPSWHAAAAAYEVAHALAPEHTETLHRLGMALHQVCRVEDAFLVFRRLHDRRPDELHWYHHLGLAYRQIGDGEAAMKCYRDILAKDPDRAHSRMNLADVLLEKKQFAQALAEYELAYAAFDKEENHHGWSCRESCRDSVRTRVTECRQALRKTDRDRPRSRVVWESAIEEAWQNKRYARVVALIEQAEQDEPEWIRERSQALRYACYAAARLAGSADTDDARREPHRKLASTWLRREVERCAEVIRRGEKESEADAREWLLKVSRSKSFDHLRGDALAGLPAEEQTRWKQLWSDAERIAMHIDESRTTDLNRLANALAGAGRRDEAVAYYRKAVELDPKFAPAQFNIGAHEQSKGNLLGALERFRLAEAEFAKEDSDFARQWHPRARMMIQVLEMQTRGVVEILEGRRLARSNREWSRAISLNVNAKKLAPVVQLVERTLRDNPELAKGVNYGLYNGACAAALLAADPTTKPDQRAHFRNLARSWLALDVGYLRKRIADGSASAVKHLRHSLTDEDFAGVRGAALDTLPQAERTAWKSLWDEIERASKQER